LQRLLGGRHYAPHARDPPTDEQTCLRDRLLFETTGRLQQGRTIYRHKTTGDFYYVDNLHFGAAAHLEVFDKRKGHRGEASLDGTLRPGTKDARKNGKVDL
jgi:hypothetical protein